MYSLIEVRRPNHINGIHYDLQKEPNANLVIQHALRFGDPMPFIIDHNGCLVFQHTLPSSRILPPFVIAVAPLPDTHPQHPNHQADDQIRGAVDALEGLTGPLQIAKETR